MIGSKDKEFLDWNNTNILANLLQAEDHLCLVKGSIPPEHGACVIKHLTVVIGESMEASKHAASVYPNDPRKTLFYRHFAEKVYKVKKDFEENGMDENSLNKVRELRKEFEREVGTNTEGCRSGFCEFKGRTGDKGKVDPEGLGKLVHECWMMVHERYPEASTVEKFKAAWDCIRKGIPSEHLEGMGELVRHCWEKVHNEMPDAPTAQKFEAVWKCMREGDPVSPDILERMREVGWEPKPAPMCVIAKEARGEPRAKAEQECINEGKLHPINVIAFEARYG